jgi:hypothetical protein
MLRGSAVKVVMRGAGAIGGGGSETRPGPVVVGGGGVELTGGFFLPHAADSVNNVNANTAALSVLEFIRILERSFPVTLISLSLSPIPAGC